MTLVRMACAICTTHRNEPSTGARAACPVCGSWSATIVPPSLAERLQGLTVAPLVECAPLP